MKHGKKYNEAAKLVDRATLYDLKTNEVLVNAPMSHSFGLEYSETLNTIYDSYNVPSELFITSYNDFYYNWDK